MSNALEKTVKGRLFLVIVIGASYLNSLPLFACDHLQAKADRYSQLKRGGGSAKQMNGWETKRKEYADGYRECIRAQPRVHKARGSKSKTPVLKADTQKIRRSDSNDPVTQKLLATCNFWINTYNRSPTPDNQVYRNTSCRALDEAEQKPVAPSSIFPTQRTLKECIKPDNAVDDEVHLCMLGQGDAHWNAGENPR